MENKMENAKKNGGILRGVTERDLRVLKYRPKKFWRNVKEIGDGAFQGTSIVCLLIPYGVERIGKNAFRDCKKLINVAMTNDVKEVGEYAFADTSLECIKLSSELTHIETGMFCGCDRMMSFAIPNKVEKIGEHAFAHCHGLYSIVIPDSVKEIAFNAFEDTDIVFVKDKKAENKELGSENSKNDGKREMIDKVFPKSNVIEILNENITKNNGRDC